MVNSIKDTCSSYCYKQPRCIESFSYEWETYAQSYGHGTESKTLYSTNHSEQNHFSTNQNAWIRHDDGAIQLRYGTNRTVATSHSYENDSDYYKYSLEQSPTEIIVPSTSLLSWIPSLLLLWICTAVYNTLLRVFKTYLVKKYCHSTIYFF